MANKKVNQLTSKPAVNLTDLFLIADPTSGQAFKTTISDLGTAIGSGVSSVNSLVGAVVLDTDDIQELVSPTNKWFTDTRARAALSASSPLTYNSGTGAFGIQVANGSQNGYLSSADWTTFNNKLSTATAASTYVPYTGATGNVNLGLDYSITAALIIKSGGTSTQFLKADGSIDTNTYLTTSSAASTYVSGSGTTNYLPRWSSSKVLTDSFIYTNGNYTEIQGQGLTASMGIVVSGRYGSVANAPKIYSSDETTGVAHIEFVNGGGEIRLGVEKSTGGQILPGSSAYATVLTAGLSGRNLEFGTNNTKRMTIDGSTGAVTLTGALSGTSATFTSTLSATGNVTIGNAVAGTNVKLIFNGVASKAAGIEFHQSGTAQWYLGNGIASEDNNFELYNSNGTMAMKIIKSTNAINFQGAATFSSSVTAMGGFGSAISSISAWGSSIVAPIIEGLAGNSISNYNAGATTPEMYFVSNGYYDGTNWIKKVASGSTQMVLSGVNQNIIFQRAASAAAGSTISWTPLMYINASSGNVGIGTTSPNAVLEVAGTSANTDFRISRTVSSSTYFYIKAPGGSPSASTMGVNGTDVMTLNSSGNVGIGTTAPSVKLHIVGGSDNTLAIDNDGSTYTSAFWRNNNANRAQIYFQNSAKEFGIGTLDASGYLAFQTAVAQERMRITSSGFVLIGSTAADPVSSNVAGISFEGSLGSGKFSRLNNACLDVNRVGGTDGEVVRMYKTGTQVGNISVTSSSTSYNTSSDYRLKEDLKSINGLEIVNKIKVYDYKWKAEDSRMDGVLAHELAEVLPYAVTGVKDGEQMQSVDYSKIVPIMVQAIKDLKAELDTLKNK